MVNPAPLWQQVAAAVRRAIQAGALRPGDRVVEAQLARQLGISRNPIREALRQLQQQGILEYRPNAGTVVTQVAPADAQMAVEMRAFLEARAVRQLCGGDQATAFATLEAIVIQMGALPAGAPLGEAEALDSQFHDQLIRATNSAMLRRIWETVDPYTWIIMSAWQRRDAHYALDYQELYADHRRLLDAMRAGSAAQAEAAIYDHIMRRLNLAGPPVEAPRTQEAAP
jgi:DNA-binding GntR family transcriptional regulator